jgi:metal-responsive CopG/Arc/MetJ family transcriptional regulator
MLSVRLPGEIEKELTRVARLEETTKTQIVREAIVDFLSRRKKEQQNTPYRLGKDLFGVYEGEADLSQNYKNKLDDLLHEKYRHR